MFELAMYARNYSFEGLKILDVEIRDKTYFGGETFGYVDITFVPLVLLLEWVL